MSDPFSSDPPPSPRPREPHEVRSDCAITFSAIHSTLREMKGEMRGIRAELKEYNRSQGELEGSVKGLWREVRDEMRPELCAVGKEVSGSQQVFTRDLAASQQAFTKDLAESQRAFTKDIDYRFRKHVEECPARRKAMKRAESDSADGIDVGAFRDDTTGVVETRRGVLIRNTSNGHYEIPRPVLWVGGLVGAAVAASGYVIHLLTSM